MRANGRRWHTVRGIAGGLLNGTMRATELQDCQTANSLLLKPTKRTDRNEEPSYDMRR